MVIKAKSSRMSADAATATRVIGSFTSCSSTAASVQPSSFDPSLWSHAADPATPSYSEMDDALVALISTFQQGPTGRPNTQASAHETASPCNDSSGHCSHPFSWPPSSTQVNGTTSDSHTNETINTTDGDGLPHLSTEALLSTGGLFDTTLGVDNMWTEWDSVYQQWG
jgi:hypothetical protein